MSSTTVRKIGPWWTGRSRFLRTGHRYENNNDGVELHFDSLNESTERWRELTSTRFGSVALTCAAWGPGPFVGAKDCEPRRTSRATSVAIPLSALHSLSPRRLGILFFPPHRFGGQNPSRLDSSCSSITSPLPKLRIPFRPASCDPGFSSAIYSKPGR